MAGRFELKESNGGQFMFNLKAANRSLTQKGTLIREEFLDMIREVEREGKRKGGTVA